MSQLKQVTFHRRGPAAGASSAAVTCDESDASGERAARIVLIDDDEVFLPAQVRQALSASRTEITSAKTGAAGVDLVRGDRPDLVLLGLRLPDQAGFAVYEEIRAIDALVPVIFLASAVSADSAIEAMRRGACDYLCKPLDVRRLQQAVVEALSVACDRRHLVDVPEDDAEIDGRATFIGRSQAILEVCKAIGLVSAQDVAVLIIGETGTGKEVAARALHRHSARAAAPFLALNCAAIPENLLESELFGHERGAFTGADRRSVGKFEQCSGGTILLDEIGDMPLHLQAKILRLLQEQVFQRVGGNDTIRTDVRVIAATHRDLCTLVSEGRFRADLFYRLAVCTIGLPPLRERRDDLPLLAHHFLSQYGRELGRDVRDIAPAAMEQLCAYAWPGNVRELQSVLKQALLRARGRVLRPAFLPDLSRRAGGPAPSTEHLDLDGFISGHLGPETNDLYDVTHREVDRLLLARAIEHANGSQRQAAQLLGISRQTMRFRLRTLAMRVARTVAANDGAGIN
jgi:DNA-binding NtrC family response regulator